MNERIVFEIKRELFEIVSMDFQTLTNLTDNLCKQYWMLTISDRADIDQEIKKAYNGLKELDDKRKGQTFAFCFESKDLFDFFQKDILALQQEMEKRIAGTISKVGRSLYFVAGIRNRAMEESFVEFAKNEGVLSGQGIMNWTADFIVIQNQWQLRNIIQNEQEIIKAGIGERLEKINASITKYIQMINDEPKKSKEIYNNGSLYMSDIIEWNPVLRDCSNIDRDYYAYLCKYIRLGGWGARRYVKAQLSIYSDILTRKVKEDDSNDGRNDMNEYRYFLLLDLLHIIGYGNSLMYSEDMKKVIKEFAIDFPEMGGEINVICMIFECVSRKKKDWKELHSHPLLKEAKRYIELIENNLMFKEQREKRFLVTGNMSAGKSSLINALVGKRIVKSSQEVCTTNVGYICSKPFEDNHVCKEISYLCLNEAGTEDPKQKMEKEGITTSSTYFRHIEEQGQRVCLIDTPGANSALNKEHKKIARDSVLNENCDKILYVLNGNKIGTDEEIRYLKWLSLNVPLDKVVFVLNKLDSFKAGEDSIKRSVEGVYNDLKKLGYKKPLVCPLSAYFALLLKKKHYGDSLSEDEEDEYELYFSKFNRKDYNLSSFYGDGISGDRSFVSMSKKCGMYGLEKILYGGN